MHARVDTACPFVYQHPLGDVAARVIFAMRTRRARRAGALATGASAVCAARHAVAGVARRLAELALPVCHARAREPHLHDRRRCLAHGHNRCVCAAASEATKKTRRTGSGCTYRSPRRTWSRSCSRTAGRQLRSRCRSSRARPQRSLRRLRRSTLGPHPLHGAQRHRVKAQRNKSRLQASCSPVCAATAAMSQGVGVGTASHSATTGS